MARFKTNLTENDVTDEVTFKDRRNILKKLGLLGLTASVPSLAFSQAKADFDKNNQSLTFKSSDYHVNATPTPFEKVAGYNNFYEFGWDKSDPSLLSKNFVTDPWTVTIDGEVDNPMTLDLDDLYTKFNLEERIYRFRCVEAWSMVIPWIGFELAELIKLATPNSHANYIAFETLYDPKQFPNQTGHSMGGFSFPYIEGLRLDEAMHPLAFLSVGLYGKKLLPQNGAPIRLVVPWKYGFKSIKSITKIRFTKNEPRTTWNIAAPHEYGFYANVNPKVAHPRWSQSSERIIGSEGVFGAKRQDTLLFNGYDEVASLYKEMDLRKFF